MESRKREIEEPFNISASKMFEALTSPRAIREWWGASRVYVDPVIGGTWAATYGEEEGGSEYVNSYRIIEFVPNERIVLGEGVLHTDGEEYPQKMGTVTEFDIQAIPEGCILRIVHSSDFEGAEYEDMYQSSLIAWQNTFEGLRRYFHYNAEENSFENMSIGDRAEETHEPPPNVAETEADVHNESDADQETHSEEFDSEPREAEADIADKEDVSNLPDEGIVADEPVAPQEEAEQEPEPQAQFDEEVPEISESEEPASEGANEAGLSQAVPESDEETYRSQVREESFKVSPEEMFAILLKPSAIRQWWGATNATVVPEVGGLWTATWGDEDNPEHYLLAKITDFKKPNRLVLKYEKYQASGKGLPFEFAPDAVTMFEIKKNGRDCTLRVEQTGFPSDPIADEFYSLCETGWKTTFEGIRRFLANQ